MITVFSPQLDKIGVLDSRQVREFLGNRDLVSRRFVNLPNALIAFDRILEQEVERVDAVPELVIKSYRSVDHLVEEMLQSLAIRGEAVFAPTLKAMRHFFSTAGFVNRMKVVECRLPQAAVSIPAGVYGSRHLFGVRKMLQTSDAPTLPGQAMANLED